MRHELFFSGGTYVIFIGELIMAIFKVKVQPNSQQQNIK